MKSITVQLPEALARELGKVVDSGWFASEDEAVRAALLEFLDPHRRELIERFQLDDIAWALKQKATE
jgi:Arc/MetJ-type ribon-helix-helix transcriptional regulator